MSKHPFADNMFASDRRGGEFFAAHSLNCRILVLDIQLENEQKGSLSFRFFLSSCDGAGSMVDVDCGNNYLQR